MALEVVKDLARLASEELSELASEPASRVASNGDGVAGSTPIVLPSPKQYLPTQGAQLWDGSLRWDGRRKWMYSGGNYTQPLNLSRSDIYLNNPEIYLNMLEA